MGRSKDERPEEAETEICFEDRIALGRALRDADVTLRALFVSGRAWPDGVDEKTLRGWLSGKIRTARPSAFARVLEMVRALAVEPHTRPQKPKARMPARRSKESRKRAAARALPGHMTELNAGVLMELKRLYRESGMTLPALMRCVPETSPPLKTETIRNWLAGKVRHVPCDHLEAIRAAWRNQVNLGASDRRAIPGPAPSLKPREEPRVIIDEAMRAELCAGLRPKGRRGAAPTSKRLGALPEGLSLLTVYWVLSGKVRSLSPSHFAFLRAAAARASVEYAAYDERDQGPALSITLTRQRQETLAQLFGRDEFILWACFALRRWGLPRGVTLSKVRRWAMPGAKTAPAEVYERLCEALRACAQYLTAAPVRTLPLNAQIKSALKALMAARRVNPASIGRMLSVERPEITGERIRGWLGGAKEADADEFRAVLQWLTRK